MISEDTHNKLIELGLHKDAFGNYFYKNHFESFIFNFEDFYCCIYDFTIKFTNCKNPSSFKNCNCHAGPKEKSTTFPSALELSMCDSEEVEECFLAQYIN